MEHLIERESKIGIHTHILSTNLKTAYQVGKIAVYLDAHELVVRWTVDLHDWQKVLKVVSTEGLTLAEVIDILSIEGFSGKELSD